MIDCPLMAGGNEPARAEIVEPPVGHDQDEEDKGQAAAMKAPAEDKADSKNKVGQKRVDLGEPGGKIPLANSDQGADKDKAARQKEAANLSDSMQEINGLSPCPWKNSFALRAAVLQIFLLEPESVSVLQWYRC